MKSKKALLLIIPCCMAVVAVIIALVLFLSGAFISPKTRVMLALANTFGSESFFSRYSDNSSDASPYGYAPEYMEDLINISKMITEIQESGYSYEADFVLKDLRLTDEADSRRLSGLALNLSGEVNEEERLAHHGIDIRFAGFRFFQGDLYANDTSVSFEAPDFYEGYIMIPTDTLGVSYNNSIFPGMLNYELSPELESALSFSPFDYLNPYEMTKYAFTASEENIEYLQDFYDSIEVEETGETRTILIGDKEQECSEYLITISEEDISDLLEAYEEWYDAAIDEILEEKENMILIYSASLGMAPSEVKEALHNTMRSPFSLYMEQLVQDHEIYVYLDRKDRLVAASYDNDFRIDYYEMINQMSPGGVFSGISDEDHSDFIYDFNLSAEIVFHGKDYLPDLYDGYIEITVLEDGGSGRINFEVESTRDSEEVTRVLTADSISTDGSGSENLENVFVMTTVYDIDDRALELEITSGPEGQEDLITIEFNCKTTVSNDGTARCNIRNFSYMEKASSGTQGFAISFDTTLSPLSEDVPSPSGEEIDILSMSQLEFMQFGFEIYENLNNNPVADIFGNL